MINSPLTRRGLKRCLQLFSVIFLCHCQLFASERPDDETLQRLGNGEILLRDARSDEAGGSARVQALVHAPARDVWDVIASCEQAFVFVRGLKECEIVEDSGDRVLIHQVVKTSWLVPTQDFVFESLREPYHRIRFQLVEGSLKAMKGAWRFTETPEGLLLDYEIHVRPAMPVPGFIVSYVMRRGMPDLIACIRGLAGGSGSRQQVLADLKLCPGSS